MTEVWTETGTLKVVPALERVDLLAEPVVAALRALPAADSERCGVAEIDPELADTAEFCAQYQLPLSTSANCVVVAGRRAGEQRHAACLVLATTRADVNGVVKRRLDVRKASFAPMDSAVGLTGMEYGGITPIGLPEGWPLLVDARIAEVREVVVGSGVRRSKLVIPGELAARLPGAEPVEDLARPVV